MNMYNFIEYSHNYSDSAASLYNFKKQEAANNDNLTVNNSSSFKDKSDLLETTETNIAANINPNVPLAHRLWRNIQILVPLKNV